MGGRWHRTCGKIHIIYGKGKEKYELRTGLMCITESYQQLGGLSL
jgi:hypothetical protein